MEHEKQLLLPNLNVCRLSIKMNEHITAPEAKMDIKDAVKAQTRFMSVSISLDK